MLVTIVPPRHEVVPSTLGAGDQVGDRRRSVSARRSGLDGGSGCEQQCQSGDDRRHDGSMLLAERSVGGVVGLAAMALERVSKESE